MKKILVVDDDPVFRKLISQLLQRAGYSVIEESGGFGAIEAVKKEIPDLVITDIIMAGMTGYEVVYHIRFELKIADLPVLVVTSKERALSAQLGNTLGVEYFHKEHSPQEIVAWVNNFFQRTLKQDDVHASETNEHLESLKRYDAAHARESKILDQYIEAKVSENLDRNKFLDD
jgi:CheY-like chemotaxis protein